MIKKCYIIPTEKKCNCNCDFCISKTRDYDKGKEFLEIDSDFITKLELLKKRGINKFEITGGGEPFLNKDISKIINTIKRVIPKSYVKIYTNGNLLKYCGEVDEIDISVTHYNDELNNYIMHPKVSIPLDVKLKFFRAQYPESKIRLSIPLLKCGINSSKELDNFIDKTKMFVNEYVVRTLYPGCPLYKENYVNFNYNNNSVVFERDNNLEEFNGIILWSDGKLYDNWDLENQRSLFSYILLKPDARTYINEIEELIYGYKFFVRERILLNDFFRQAINLYKDKDINYLKLVKEHLLNSSTLFGNQGIVYVLDGDKSISDLESDTEKLKQAIRNTYGFTGKYNKTVSFNGQNYHLNLVHSPDANVDLYDRDLSLIYDFENTKVLTNEEMKLVRKYRSFNI